MPPEGTPSISKSSSARVPAIIACEAAGNTPDPGRELVPSASGAGAGRSSEEPAALPCDAAADPEAAVRPDEENRLATQLTPEDNRPGDSLPAAADVGADEVDEVDGGPAAGCEAGAGVARGAGAGVDALTAAEAGAAATLSGAAK